MHFIKHTTWEHDLIEYLKGIIKHTGPMYIVLEHCPYRIDVIAHTGNVTVTSGLTNTTATLLPPRLNDGDYDEFGVVTRYFNVACSFAEGNGERILRDRYVDVLHGRHWKKDPVSDVNGYIKTR